MEKIVRIQFMGNWIIFWLLCISIVGVPMAILYFVNSSMKIDSEVPDAEEFVKQFRSRRFKRSS